MFNDAVQINALCVNKVDVYSMTAYMLDNRKCVDIVDYWLLQWESVLLFDNVYMAEDVCFLQFNVHVSRMYVFCSLMYMYRGCMLFAV